MYFRQADAYYFNTPFFTKETDILKFLREHQGDDMIAIIQHKLDSAPDSDDEGFSFKQPEAVLLHRF